MQFKVRGLNHLGLVVEDIELAKAWFVGVLGLTILEDRGELIFLRAGQDILAIKTPRMAVAKPEHGGEANYSADTKAGWQTLDHYGFYASSPQEVDAFTTHIAAQGGSILKGPYDRSDGRSVYFRDPCGMVGEFLYLRPECLA